MNSNFDLKIYQNSPRLIIGFHGCDKSVADKIINSGKEHLVPSDKEYDWLGSGIYFWQNDPQRALEWAKQKMKRSPNKIKEPAVIGAVIDAGMCLDLCERQSIEIIQKSYYKLKEALKCFNMDINERYINKAPDEGGFKLIRPLDCAVINNVHSMLKQENISYDTVIGYFQEGNLAFEGAGIHEKSHIQICVRNTDCIKGYFLPRTN